MATTERSPRAPAQPTISSAQFRAVIGATLFIMLGFGLIVPALPQFAKQFGVGDAGVGVILFAFGLTRLIGDFFAASLIDRFGERLLAGTGAAIVGVSSIAAGLSHSYIELVIFRGIGGFGSAFFLGALTAYLVATIAPDERGRAMSLFQASIGIGLLLGPVFGGLVIAAARVNTPFYIYGVVCLLFFPLSMRALRGEHAAPRTVPPGAAESAAPAVPSWQRIKPLLASKAYRAALGASAVSFIVTSAPQTLLPRYWTDTLHLSKASSGLPFFAEALAGMIVIWHAGALSDRRGRKFVLVPAMGACAVASLALGVFGGAVALLILMGALGLTNGYTRPGPTAIIADVSSPESRAVAVSGYRIAGDVGALIGPLLAGVLAEFVGYGWAWVGVAACVFVVFGMTVAAEETAPIEQPS